MKPRIKQSVRHAKRKPKRVRRPSSSIKPEAVGTVPLLLAHLPAVREHANACVQHRTIRILKRLRTIQRDNPNAPRTLSVEILSTLQRHHSLLLQLEAILWHDLTTDLLRKAKQERERVRVILQRRLTNPEAPPATLRERMTRDTLDHLEARLHDLAGQVKALQTSLKTFRRWKQAYEFHGAAIAAAQREIMNAFVHAGLNQKHAANCTVEILQDWDTAAAPESAEHVRVAYIRRKRPRKSPTGS